MKNYLYVTQIVSVRQDASIPRPPARGPGGAPGVGRLGEKKKKKELDPDPGSSNYSSRWTGLPFLQSIPTHHQSSCL